MPHCVQCKINLTSIDSLSDYILELHTKNKYLVFTNVANKIVVVILWSMGIFKEAFNEKTVFQIKSKI